ncbi:MAG TPA: malto-oligosyltrehalose trehalohydrolase [Tepidisphaeraceae bacterium]|nr:malto-oligosyltrehalose trehalohydrolase [Tepidisphaeraceae bacterium]
MTAASPTIARRLPIGAEVYPAGVHFRVWAPKRKTVRVVINDAEPVALASEPGGYFSVLVDDTKPGDRYHFLLHGESHRYPDPASRFQPEGPHGPSEIVDAAAFRWTDHDFNGVAPSDRVVYEMHVGTFTLAGTWAAAIERLDDLKDVGVTVIEVMPVAEFAGRFGWGYDGVDLFAPTHLYGRPDDFRRFVDAAHARGMAVILDVVYNHLGPDGNYLKAFADDYFSTKHHTDWGEAINFDGAHSAGVREFYVANAVHWVREYHLDGFRFDATQNIYDDGERHILADITAAARKAADSPRRPLYMVNENEPQDTRLVRSCDVPRGCGMDALWNDDFHHSAMVVLSGRNEAYFTDYHGTPQEFISACKWGYLYQGQRYKWQQKRRGTPALDLLPTAFVNYTQNHDQIANYGLGLRQHYHCAPGHLKAMTALLLLAPQTPMLFQGQEWAATSPFNYFADHTPELNEMIRKGRGKELAQFPSVSIPEMQAALPVPSDPVTFGRCKLDWDERDKRFHQQILALHKDLLDIRRTEPIFRRTQRRGDMDGAVLGHDAFVLRFFGESDPAHPTANDDRLLVINFGYDLHLDIVPEPLLAPPSGKVWETQLTTEHPRYGGSGNPPIETTGEDWRLPGENWRIPGRCAVLLRPV